MSFRSLKFPPDAVKFMTAPASAMPVQTTASVHAGATVDLEAAADVAPAEQDPQDHQDHRQTRWRRGRSVPTAASSGSLPPAWRKASTPTATTRIQAMPPVKK